MHALLPRRYQPHRLASLRVETGDRHNDLAELRMQTLCLFASATVVIALGILVYLATGRIDDEIPLLAVVAVLLVTAAAAYLLTERAPTLAVWLFLGGLLAATALAGGLLQQPLVAIAGGLVALAAVFLAGSREGHVGDVAELARQGLHSGSHFLAHRLQSEAHRSLRGFALR